MPYKVQYSERFLHLADITRIFVQIQSHPFPTVVKIIYFLFDWLSFPLPTWAFNRLLWISCINRVLISELGTQSLFSKKINTLELQLQAWLELDQATLLYLWANWTHNVELSNIHILSIYTQWTGERERVFNHCTRYYPLSSSFPFCCSFFFPACSIFPIRSEFFLFGGFQPEEHHLVLATEEGFHTDPSSIQSSIQSQPTLTLHYYVF